MFIDHTRYIWIYIKDNPRIQTNGDEISAKQACSDFLYMVLMTGDVISNPNICLFFGARFVKCNYQFQIWWRVNYTVLFQFKRNQKKLQKNEYIQTHRFLYTTSVYFVFDVCVYFFDYYSEQISWWRLWEELSVCNCHGHRGNMSNN